MKRLFFNISFTVFALSLLVTLIAGLGPLVFTSFSAIGAVVAHASAGVAIISAALTLVAMEIDKKNHEGPPGPYLGG